MVYVCYALFLIAWVLFVASALAFFTAAKKEEVELESILPAELINKPSVTNKKK